MFSLPFNIEKSILIDKPMQEVFASIGDFSKWAYWSPWTCQESECPIDISGRSNTPGHKQQWDGKRIGSGDMTLVKCDEPTSLEYNLNFLKPWKSKSHVTFSLKNVDNMTEVTWEMKGSIPIFLFFLKKMMKAFIGMDYLRGLNMLKEFLETGEVLSKSSVMLDEEQKTFRFTGIRRSCASDEIGTLMEKDFGHLETLLEEKKLAKPDIIFSLYHQYDLVKQKCDYTAGYGYFSKDVEVIGDLEKGVVEGHTALRVDHIGSYEHLGNAWSTIISHQRYTKKKPLKKPPMYEVYSNNPKSTPNKDLHTKLYFPIR